MCWPCVTTQWHQFGYFSDENNEVSRLLMEDDIFGGSRAHAWMIGLLCSVLQPAREEGGEPA
ncbi:hypothetical protein LCGC14_2288170 [marine sediment metagenome]|uniref:Uncharacterized protein n=1 Tax=marine sediment metagenome TaxID=412755 RepID=A0A0F9CRW3_9ZZZZ